MNVPGDAFNYFIATKRKLEERRRRETETQYLFVEASEVVVKVTCTNDVLRDAFFPRVSATYSSAPSDLSIFLSLYLQHLTTPDVAMPARTEVVCSNEISFVIENWPVDESLSFEHDADEATTRKYPVWHSEVIIHAA